MLIELVIVKYKVNIALNKLLERDRPLLLNDSSEWSVAHRLAVYIENEFDGWDVDCEYNRVDNGSKPKYSNSRLARPDIIVHRRGRLTKDDNLIAIEIKKNATDVDDNKLKSYTSPTCINKPYQYQYGVTISFNPIPETNWFIDGQKLPI